MRAVRRVVTFLFFVTTIAAVAGVLGLSLAASGQSLPLLRALAGRVGQLMTGQRTEQLDLQVRVQPAARQLSGTARLQVRAKQADRRRLYFILNDGLRIHEVWQDDRVRGARQPLSYYRLWSLTVIELPELLAANETIGIGLTYSGSPRAGALTFGANLLEPDDVVMMVDDFWYPCDLQSFFQADVEITLPTDLMLVHNGREMSRVDEGASTRIRWSAPRPITGLALIAGRYRAWSGTHGGTRYRALLPDGVILDGERVLAHLMASDDQLSSYYGASGFPQLTVFVNRRLPHGFHDGSGLIGVTPRDFHGGDYGFGAIAHQVAHNWWGETVAPQRFQSGTGSEWIVEGFAEFSSWWATGKQSGEFALLRRLADSFYDPNHAGTLASISAVDTALDRSARQTIDEKGAYVSFMLQQRLGEEKFGAAARQFLDRFRYQSVTEEDLRLSFGAVSGEDLDPFFATWVRSNAALDLSLDPRNGRATVRNLRTASPPARLDLWRFPRNAGPERQIIGLDATTAVGNADRLVLDPLGLTADMYRSNNVLPRHDNPRIVARSARGDVMVVYGAPYPWAPASVVDLDRRGQRRHSWAFDGGLLSRPVWSADGTRVLAVETPRGGAPSLLALNVTDGSRHRIGTAAVATATSDVIVIARGSRLVRVTDGQEYMLADYPGAQVVALLASPDGRMVAYAVQVEDNMDLRCISIDGGGEQLLFTWPATAVLWQWGPDSSRLFVALPGDWDWQLWELALDRAAPRRLVGDAAGIADLAISPDGARVAIVAQAALNYERPRREVFLIDRSSRQVRRFDLNGKNGNSLTWLDEDSLLVVVSDPAFPAIPFRHELQRLQVSDGSLLPFP